MTITKRANALWRRVRTALANHAVVVLYSGSAVATVAVFVAQRMDASGSRWLPAGGHPLSQFALAASMVAFILAAALVSSRPLLGHSGAFIAALLSFISLAWRELSELAWANSWLLLNVPDKDVSGFYQGPGIFTFAHGVDLPLASATILAVALAVISLVFSGLRLLPESWAVGRLRVRERVWPAFAASGFVLVAWYGCSVRPYRIPAKLNHTFPAALQILHVEKRGLEVRETAIRVFKDGKFERWQRTRRLFAYRFGGQAASGVLPGSLRLRALALADALPADVRTPPPKVLTAWNAEGWYVLTSERLLSYTSEYHSASPPEVVALFRDVEKSPATRAYPRHIEKDICFGFCYDPAAALGFAYENQHCQTRVDGTTHCQ